MLLAELKDSQRGERSLESTTYKEMDNMASVPSRDVIERPF